MLLEFLCRQNYRSLKIEYVEIMALFGGLFLNTEIYENYSAVLQKQDGYYF